MAPAAPLQVVPKKVARRVLRFARRQALRVRVRCSLHSLDARLAAGVDPASDPLLHHAERQRPRGIAMVEQLLSDGWSVLYVDTAPRALEAQVRTAIEYLVGERVASPEAWFSISNELDSKPREESHDGDRDGSDRFSPIQ